MSKINIFFITFLLSFIVGCSSTTPMEKLREKEQLINKHLAEGKTYINGNFDTRFISGIDNGINISKVGVAVYPADYAETLAISAAVDDAKFKLIESAPSEYESMVQRAIGNTLGMTGEYNKIETSVTELKRLSGIKSSRKDIQCKKAVEPTSDLSYKRTLECRAIVSVSKRELKKAFDFTLQSKYGIKEKSFVEKTLNKQLENSVLKSSSKKNVKRETANKQ